MEREAKISIFVMIFLIGIPTASRFYPPLFAGIAEELPLDIILTGMTYLGLITFGGLIGWFIREAKIEIIDVELEQEIDRSDSDSISLEEVGEDESRSSIESIEGCIEIGESCWRGSASISDGRISETYVEYRALCPHCQTVMYDGEDRSAAVATTGTTYWDCPSCGHRTVEEYSKYRDAQNLFQSHIERIIESDGEVYSLDSLIEGIEGEITPRGIWERYSQVMDDDQISMNCFH